MPAPPLPLAEPWFSASIILAAWLLLTFVLTLAGRKARSRQHPLEAAFRALRNLLLPTLAAVLLMRISFSIPTDDTALKIVETLAWIAAIHAALALAGSTVFYRPLASDWRGRMPKLIKDIARGVILVIGLGLVLKFVWNEPLTGLFATLGVTSIVLGFALQETLGNLIAGVAVLFERPFQIGDWIQVGDTQGKVHEINWRSVRVRTRALDLVVIPHSSIAKEKLINYSSPTLAHAEYPVVGFSYDDPPNKVKRILQRIALNTPGIVPDPPPEVRVVNYAAYTIDYQVRFVLEDYDRLPAIRDGFMTQVWYAARRNGLTIPFPIQTSYEYRMPRQNAPARLLDPKAALQNVPVFVPLDRDELEELARDAVVQQFGKGERIVHQGDPGDALYVITEGAAIVTLAGEAGAEKEVARVGRGEFFGEMALLTGEARSASVTAVEDLEVLAIYKEALGSLLQRRPKLAEEIAEIAEARRQGLRAAREIRDLAGERRQQLQASAGVLLKRIKHFFGI